MRAILISIIIVVFCSAAKAQNKPKHAVTSQFENETPIYDDDYTRPSFPGGLNQFYKYLAKSIHYPTSAIKNKVQGKVHLNFTIEKDGSIDKIRIVKGVSKDIDAEAIRVIKGSPKWIPGTHHQKPIPFRYSLPLSFELPNKTK